MVELQALFMVMFALMVTPHLAAVKQFYAWRHLSFRSEIRQRFCCAEVI
ncbi:hypothetical protein [Halopseudomonas pelagia]|nr:hypothetical protein [Halopseudomonas pelagia]|tara:strand:- start:307 stop:453 length:147 start_codon:yes stop_codon:yes gene_type:complete